MKLQRLTRAVCSFSFWSALWAFYIVSQTAAYAVVIPPAEAFGPDNPAEVPRLYSTYFLTQNPSQSLTIRTANSSVDADPVLLVRHLASPTVWMDDDAGGGVEASVTISNPESLPNSSALIQVTVLSYDSEFGGTTDVVFDSNGVEERRISGVEFGAMLRPSVWDAGDVALTTGHYERETFKYICEQRLSSEWVFERHACKDPTNAGAFLSEDELCSRANQVASDRGHDFPLTRGDVFPYGRGCEYTNRAKHTVLIAIDDWTKSEWVPNGYAPCGGWGGMCPQFRQTNLELNSDDIDNGSIDGLTSSASGYGHNARLDFAADSVSRSGDSEIYSVVVIGLNPWNTWYEYYRSPLSARVPSDLIRYYRDSPTANDQDEDGLSDNLESLIGGYMDPQHQDSDKDGIIDALELYGTDEFPMPDIGGHPGRTTLFVEIDYVADFWESRQPYLDRFDGQSVESIRDRIYRWTGEAFKEAGFDFIALTGEVRLRDDSSGYSLVPPVNETAEMPAAEVDPDDPFALGTRAADTEAFDLKHYIFVRRVAWFKAIGDSGDDSAGITWGSPTDEYGRQAAVAAPGRVVLHELGHLFGLHHGGHQPIVGKPNYWSVMNSDRWYWSRTRGGTVGAGYLKTWSTQKTHFNWRYANGVPFRFSNSDEFLVLDEFDLDEHMGLKGMDNNDDTIPMVYRWTLFPWRAQDSLDFEEEFGMTWFDWDGDGDFDDRFTEGNLREPCSSPPCAPEHSSLEPFNDIAYLEGLDHSAMATCQYRDSQRSLMGMPVLQNCSTAIRGMYDAAP